MHSSGSMPSSAGRVERRTAIKWLLTAAAAMALAERGAWAAASAGRAGAGYGPDPDLLRDYRPGDLWPLTFNEHQRRTAAALCALIIPADEKSPGAATLGIHDFIDEWISAPYPGHAADRQVIIAGLAWLDDESNRRSGTAFINLSGPQQEAIGRDICLAKTASPGFKEAADFFTRFRDLTAGGFYTTPEGMKDIGYTGNMPLATFDGPPPAVLRQLGLG